MDVLGLGHRSHLGFRIDWIGSLLTLFQKVFLKIGVWVFKEAQPPANTQKFLFPLASAGLGVRFQKKWTLKTFSKRRNYNFK